MLKVYFKPNCATCRTALSLLKNNTDEEMELIEYLVETPSAKEIKEILQMLGMKAEDLVRKKEHLYKEKYERKKISNDEWIKIMVKNPILIERPIVVKDGKALIGRPPEKILEIL
jgi:arsenate reductase